VLLQGEPFWVGGHRRFAEDGDDNGIAGGGDGGGDADNEWRWSDGSPLLTFKNWFPGLPDDRDIITGGPESCLMVSIIIYILLMSSFLTFRGSLMVPYGQIGSA
jgi:hypothetical protein